MDLHTDQSKHCIVSVWSGCGCGSLSAAEICETELWATSAATAIRCGAPHPAIVSSTLGRLGQSPKNTPSATCYNVRFILYSVCWFLYSVYSIPGWDGVSAFSGAWANRGRQLLRSGCGCISWSKQTKNNRSPQSLCSKRGTRDSQLAGGFSATKNIWKKRNRCWVTICLFILLSGYTRTSSKSITFLNTCGLWLGLKYLRHHRRSTVKRKSLQLGKSW